MFASSFRDLLKFDPFILCLFLFLERFYKHMLSSEAS
jgi:hypothetical protein